MSLRMTASAIASLNLPGVPKSKVGIHAMAEREKWPFEEVKGVGGTRRLYEVPQRLLAAKQAAESTDSPSSNSSVVGTVVAGSSSVNPATLEWALQALAEFEQETGRTISGDRRSAVVALLYDYLAKAQSEADGQEAIKMIFRAIG